MRIKYHILYESILIIYDTSHSRRRLRGWCSRVEGKGSKQRLVPISETAIREIKNYLLDRNLMVVKKGFEDILFLSRRGTALSRIMVFHIIKQQTEILYESILIIYDTSHSRRRLRGWCSSISFRRNCRSICV